MEGEVCEMNILSLEEVAGKVNVKLLNPMHSQVRDRMVIGGGAVYAQVLVHVRNIVRVRVRDQVRDQVEALT